MNNLFTSLKQGVTPKAFSAFVIMSMVVLSVGVLPQTALAAAGNYSIVGDYSLSGTTVNLFGTASATPYTGKSSDQVMGVDWSGACDAKSAVEFPFDSITFVGGSGGDQNNGSFSDATWSTSHDFLVSGTYSICVKVYHGNFNGNEGSDAATFSAEIYIPPSNIAPVASNLSVLTNEDTATSSAATAVDADSDPLTYATTSSPTNGTITSWNSSNGAFTYSPNADYFGADSFTFVANDGTDDSNTATVSITVNPVNDAPSFTKGADETVDEDAGAQTVNGWATSISTGPANESGQTVWFVVTNDNNALFSAQPAIAANGDLTYTPAANANGSATVTVVMHDNGGVANGGVDQSAGQTFTITVNPVNDAPVALDDAYSTPEDTTLNVGVPGVLSNDTDLEGNPLTAILTVDVGVGTLTLNANGSFEYIPAAAFNGIVTFKYKANDGADSNEATVTINVSSVNDVPVANTDDYSTDEDTPLNVLPADGVLTNDTDDDSDPLTAVWVSDPSHGTLTLNFDGSFDYTPDSNYNGPDSFTYKANDGTADSGVATVNITVNPINDAPVADDQIDEDALVTDEDVPLSAAVTASDVDVPTTLTYSTTSNPTNGVITSWDSATGDFVYTPNPNYNGPDSFTFVANDGTDDSNEAAVEITVNPVNDAPTITLIGADPLNLVEGDPFVDPGATADDIEDGDITGSIIVSGTVDTNTPGVYPLVYEVSDSGSPILSASTTREVIVTAQPVENTEALCSDEIDNDNDDLVDLDDPDCEAFIPPPPPPAEPPPPPGGNGPVNFGFVAGGGGQVLGASTTGEVLGEACSMFLTEYLHINRSNSREQVIRLQEFLNEFVDAGLPVTGYFGPLTFAAVKKFQLAYADRILGPWVAAGQLASKDIATGYVYLTTRKTINLLKCESLTIDLPPLVPDTNIFDNQ